jgi:M6 family metalloprotease-like protein
MKRTAFAMLILSAVPCLWAMQPPRPSEIERLKERGQYEARLAFALEKGNHVLKLEATGLRAAGVRGLPPTGVVKTLVLLVEFSDYRYSQTAATINGAMFGEGDKANFPLESLHAYYDRSSYGALDIQGSTLGWYRAAHPRDWYTNDAEGLIKEVLAHYDAQGHDFSQYDNDGDGMIDYFALYWTGPDTGWGSFWWGWNGWFYDSNYTIDGKRLGNFSWMWEEVGAYVIIHETGHSLGLPDYYDYDGSVGPGGGVGGLDIMDGLGDHNGFSKWVLGWLQPQVATGSLAGVDLPPAALQPSAVIMAAGAGASDPFREYFIVQNRARVGNDQVMPADGLLVFHVDARRGCGGDFLYNNSYTEHKLLRVVEADGNDSIESGGWGSAGDYYTAASGKALTPLTQPSTDLYAGRTSGAWMTNLSVAGSIYRADFRVHSPARLPAVRLNEPADGATGVSESPTVRWDPVPGNQGYAMELYWDTAPVYRTRAPRDAVSMGIPPTVVMPTASHSVRVKALGDGETTGTGDFARSHFVIGCEDEPAWITRTFDDPPCSVWVPSVAYDPSTGRTVMFGGSNGTTTFEYDGEVWRSYDSDPAPPYRWYGAMAYDPVNRAVLLFGGYNYNTGETYGDTWLYSAHTHTWTEITAWGPWPDWAAKMAPDPARNRVVLYQPGYTWEWDGSEWAEIYDANTPWIWYTDIAHDATNGSMVLFGGDTGALSDQTWVFGDGRWTRRQPQRSPSARFWGEVYTDAATGRVMLFGGSDGSSTLADSWEWDGTTWTEVRACTFLPFGLYPPMGDYDARRAVFVVTSSGNPVHELRLPGEAPQTGGHGRPVEAP